MKAKASRRALLAAALRTPGANSSLPPWPRSSPAASSTPLAGAPPSSAARALKPSTLVKSRDMGPLRKTGGLGGRMKEAVPAWLPCLPEPAQPAARAAINKTHNPASRTSASRDSGQQPIPHFIVGISLRRISEPIRCKSKQINPRQNPVHRSFRWKGYWACLKDHAPSGAPALALYPSPASRRPIRTQLGAPNRRALNSDDYYFPGGIFRTSDGWEVAG